MLSIFETLGLAMKYTQEKENILLGKLPSLRMLSSAVAGFTKNCFVGESKPGRWGWKIFWAPNHLGLLDKSTK